MTDGKVEYLCLSTLLKLLTLFNHPYIGFGNIGAHLHRHVHVHGVRVFSLDPCEQHKTPQYCLPTGAGAGGEGGGGRRRARGRAHDRQ